MARQNNLYFGGVPFDPDIRKIREAYPDSSLEEGQVIPYEQIEAVLQVKKGTSRFLGVTNSWRKRVNNENNGLRIETEPGEGFKVLNEEEKAEYSWKRFREGMKKFRNAFVRSAEVDRSKVSEDTAATLNSIQEKTGSMIATNQIGPKSKKPNMLED